MGYFCWHIAKYTEKLDRLRIQRSIECWSSRQTYRPSFSVFQDYLATSRLSLPIIRVNEWAKKCLLYGCPSPALKMTFVTKEGTYQLLCQSILTSVAFTIGWMTQTLKFHKRICTQLNKHWLWFKVKCPATNCRTRTRIRICEQFYDSIWYPKILGITEHAQTVCTSPFSSPLKGPGDNTRPLLPTLQPLNFRSSKSQPHVVMSQNSTQNACSNGSTHGVAALMIEITIDVDNLFQVH